MRPTPWNGPLVAMLLAAVVLIAGCGGNNNNALGPQFQPEVANNVDNFQFQATGLTGVTQTLTYSWRNTGTQAGVDQSCAITGGTAMLSLRDSTGTQVYSKSLTESGSFPSSAGLAGAWTIRVTLNQVKGTLNFRAQKM
jgi:hypothetical protein